MRLFVALDLPWSVRARLADLGTGLIGARWTPPENYHLTLRFIGEVPRHVAEDLDATLAGVQARAFAIELAGVGVAEKAGRVSALWAGVTRNPALDHLRSKVEVALQRAGLPPERRRFIPHVTLARIAGADAAKLAGWMQSHNLFRSAPVPVAHFTLFSSLLGKEQAAYTAEMDYPLL